MDAAEESLGGLDSRFPVFPEPPVSVDTGEEALRVVNWRLRRKGNL